METVTTEELSKYYCGCISFDNNAIFLACPLNDEKELLEDTPPQFINALGETKDISNGYYFKGDGFVI